MSHNPPQNVFVVMDAERQQSVVHWDRHPDLVSSNPIYPLFLPAQFFYEVFRTEKSNLQDFVSLGQISSLDPGGFVDTLFVDGLTTPLAIDSTYFYKVSANLPFDWTVRYNAEVVPENSNPKWPYFPSFTSELLNFVQDGIFQWRTGRYRIEDPNITSAGAAVYIRAKVKLINPNLAADLRFMLGTEDKNVIVEVSRTELHFFSLSHDGSGVTSFVMDTTDAFHDYILFVNGTVIQVYVDGVLRLDSHVNPTQIVIDTNFVQIQTTGFSPSFPVRYEVARVYYSNDLTPSSLTSKEVSTV